MRRYGCREICQSCGTTPVCDGCRANHEAACAANSKRKSRGQGPTIRQQETLDDQAKKATGISLAGLLAPGPYPQKAEAKITAPEVVSPPQTVGGEPINWEDESRTDLPVRSPNGFDSSCSSRRKSKRKIGFRTITSDTGTSEIIRDPEHFERPYARSRGCVRIPVGI